MVKPHPEYRTHATASKQKFNYSFLYLLGLENQFSARKDAVVHLDTFGSPQRDSTHFGATLSTVAVTTGTCIAIIFT